MAPIGSDLRIKELEQYLDRGFFYIALNDPPLGALERFRGVSVEEYNERCLNIARNRFETIKDSLSKQ